MLGDTAIAVNPSDDRYAQYIGKHVILPVVDKEIPVIGDSYVDVTFGTGVLKMTPAHDLNDFEIGKRCKLDIVKVIDDDGRMNENAVHYRGMDRFECREKIVEELDKKGLLEKIEPYALGVGKCYRCKTVVEPSLSLQWFLRMKPLAEPAIEAVRTHRVRIIPEMWEKTYFEWMENIRDWCISRQIWWGHRFLSGIVIGATRRMSLPKTSVPAKPVKENSDRSRMCSTPGFRPVSGPSQPSGGRMTQRT